MATKPRSPRPESHALVYSTQGGRRCRNCGETTGNCRCRHKAHVKPEIGDGKVRIRRDQKGRRGKTVTTVSGLALGPDELADLARELKRICGSGGSIKDGVIEIQGDHRESCRDALAARGHAAILVG